jgi:hypothetical protein
MAEREALRWRHRGLTVGACLALLSSASTARSDGGCADEGALRVGLTAGLGAGFGAAGALGVSGILAAADPDSDYSFAVGALAGIGVTSGLAVIYAIVDGATDCAMVRESDGIAWSVPIVLGLVGSLLPLAVWGASGQEEAAAGDTSQGMRAAAPAPQLSWTISF